MNIIVDSKESAEKKAAFEMLLNAKIESLPEGDIIIENDDGKRWVFERKTWGDAYSSWTNKRLQNQISRMVENCDNYVLLVEGSWAEVYADASSIKGLQTFFNRMCVEVCPVIYTDSFDETIRYIRSFSLRVKDGTVNTLVRPTTVITSTRNKHHAMLEQIPRVGRTTAKKIYAAYDNVADFVTNWENAIERGVSKGVTWKAVDDFIKTEWATSEAKVIVRKE
jgi:ERCC4-type nuclease